MCGYSIDKFTVPFSGRITLNVQADMTALYYKLYDGKGNKLHTWEPRCDRTTQVINAEYQEDLTKGTYYLAVEQYASYTGSYSFKLSCNCNHMYSDWKVTKAATVFKSGLKSHTCTICGKTENKSIKKLKPTIKLSSTKKKLSKKKSYVLKISKLAKGDSVKSVSSSKKKIVSVKKVKKNQYKLTAKKKGVSTITVKLKSGKKAKCKITVK